MTTVREIPAGFFSSVTLSGMAERKAVASPTPIRCGSRLVDETIEIAAKLSDPRGEGGAALQDTGLCRTQGAHDAASAFPLPA